MSLLMKEIFENWRGFTESLGGVLGDVELNLKVLTTPEAQAKGFMNAPEPTDSFGLLFKYPEPSGLGFWMKNVSFDLDLLAFDDDRRLFQVIRLKANDPTIRKISKPCRYVLELKSGWCKRNNIKLGMTLELK